MAKAKEISYEEMQKLLQGNKGKATPAASPTGNQYRSISVEKMNQLLGSKTAPAPKEAFALPAEKFQAGLPPALRAGSTPTETVLETPEAAEGAAMARYGPTIAATMLTGGLSFMPSVLANAGIVGASEFTARQIERGLSSPEGQNVLEDLKAGRDLALLDAGITSASMGSLKLAGLGLKKLARSRFGKEILESRKLFKNNIEKIAAKKLAKTADYSDPFDLTIAELSREDGGLVAALDDFASSGTGSGVMKRFRKKRLDYYQNVINDYYDDLLDKKDKHGIAAFLKQGLGDTQDPGFLLRPADAYKKHLYNLFDQELTRNHASDVIDLSFARKYLLESGNSPALKAYKEVAKKYIELLPPLRATGKQSEAEIAKLWKNVSVMKLEKAGRQMDAVVADMRFDQKKAAQQAGDFVGKVKKSFAEYVEKNPDLNSLWQEAKQFRGNQAETLENTLINKIRKKLKDEPAAVAELFKVTGENSAIAHDNLIRLKEAFMSAAGQSKQTGKSLVSSVDAESFEFLSKKQAVDYYEQNILQPLRFSFLKQSISDNVLSGTKLLKNIEKVEKSSSKYLTELFGSDIQVRNLRALARVLQQAETKPGQSIFIALKTAQAAGGILGTGAYLLSDDPQIKKLGAATAVGSAGILLSPYSLAKILTNRKLTQNLVNGIRRGPDITGSLPSRLLMTLRRVSELKVASEFFKTNPSSNAIQYYTIDQEATK